MDHERVGRAVAVVTAIYVVVLAVWALVLLPKAPDGTVPYQIAALVAGFGAALGLAMMAAGRPTADERRMRDHGLEGWAVVDEVREIGTGAEVDLTITVPGSGSYPGTVRREGSVRYEVGATVPVVVDPDDRTRIRL
ncbi:MULTISPECIES: hypothetical protein [Nocardiaceae]|uniref:DUF4175 domain-containing protein n=1 Tax=Rhodococcoides corynebacterioides TaxID=53972 RepID=A0ABS2KYY6_9NOCA|nr:MULTISPECIES: hypothetical protein [Rhodococcus]MBM7417146.1 hypothetical protein [Rhodococcus corynebacterioides]MBP1115399.1 hypothetical protein [Rhodococcus sp. PvP016]